MKITIKNKSDMRFFLSIVLASSFCLSMQKHGEIILYDPFKDGYTYHDQFAQIADFNDIYVAYSPIIMENFGPEITQFCKKYPKAESARIIRRYIYALIIRIAFTEHEDRDIEVIKSTVPANVLEFCYIMNERIPRDYRYEDKKKMQKILKDRFQGIKELMNNPHLR